MSLVTDNKEILNQKDIEWSSKFISATEPDPISNQSKLPVEKQEESQQPRKTQVNSSIHKESSVTYGDPYSAFLAEQKKREVEWATNRVNKKAKCTANTEKDLEAVNQQLAAKEAECKTLKGQLDNIQLANVSVVEAVHNKVQEGVCKMMETLQDTLSATEDNMSLRLNKIEQRLDSLEKVFSDPGVNCGPVPQTGNLQTIDHEAFWHSSAMIRWKCSNQCLQLHQHQLLRKHRHSSHQPSRTT